MDKELYWLIGFALVCGVAIALGLKAIQRRVPLVIEALGLKIWVGVRRKANSDGVDGKEETDKTSE